LSDHGHIALVDRSFFIGRLFAFRCSILDGTSLIQIEGSGECVEIIHLGSAMKTGRHSQWPSAEQAAPRAQPARAGESILRPAP
jgi:hypothetical protein